jgi:hypothetical protein
MKMDDDLWDGEAEEELITLDKENLYNNDFKRALVKCDRRVIFTDHEIKQLEDLDVKMSKLVVKILSNIDQSVLNYEDKLVEDKRKFYRKAEVLNEELRVLEAEASELQLKAEKLFMHREFDKDVLSIVYDANRILDDCYKSYGDLIVKVFLLKESNEAKIKLIFDTVLDDIRMHVNYLKDLKEIEPLANLVTVKVKNLVGSINDFDKILIELLKKEWLKEESEKPTLRSVDRFEVIRQGPMLGWLSTVNSKVKGLEIDSELKKKIIRREGLTVYICTEY